MNADDQAGTAVETCFYHRDRETGRHCTRCGRPACPECLRAASVGAHCFQCVRDAAPARSETRRVQRVLAGHPLNVTKVLIGANVAVFLLGVALDGGVRTRGELAIDYGLFGPFVGQFGEWWRIFTSGFLHAGMLHLGLNMMALWFLGRMLEPALGSARFAGVYVASLIGGSFGALLASPNALTVGASGAIYGLLGAAFTGSRARGLNPFDSGIGGLLLINLLVTFAVPGISIGGHLGGLIAGGLLGFVLLHPSTQRRVGVASLSVSAIAVIGLIGALWAANL
ncbi:MAG: rhomboid family intramembrane serine protease [Actinomycetota bacterium]